MEYRGIEYAVVQTIPSEWRWSVKGYPDNRMGAALDRRNAIRVAEKVIDQLLNMRLRPAE